MKETPLIRAAHNGHLQMVQFLVQQGADVDCIDLVRGSLFTSLQLAITCAITLYGHCTLALPRYDRLCL